MDGHRPEDPPRPSPLAVGAAVPGAPPRRPGAPIDSENLFAGATEVQISHRGSLYRLKQTALGKLILTK